MVGSDGTLAIYLPLGLKQACIMLYWLPKTLFDKPGLEEYNCPQQAALAGLTSAKKNPPDFPGGSFFTQTPGDGISFFRPLVEYRRRSGQPG